MRRSLNSGHTLVSTYTCIFCEHIQATRRHSQKLGHQIGSRSPLSTQTATRTKRNVFRRHLSQSHRLAAVEQTLSQSPKQEPVLEYSFSMKPKETKNVRSSQIRQSLRAWSAQNERVKQDEIPDFLPYEGKLTRLPNSLFIGAEQEVKEHEDEEHYEMMFDEEGDGRTTHGSGRVLQPGSLMSHKSLLAPRQNVVYLGDIGAQSLMLLSDGRWVAEETKQKRACVSVNRHEIVPGFLTPEEINALRAHMPKHDVLRAFEEGKPSVPTTVIGSLPDDVVAWVLPKLRAFQDAEARFIRDHKAQLEQMYDHLAFEDRWRSMRLKELPPVTLGVKYDSMTYVAKKAFVHYVSTFNPLFIGMQTAETVTYLIGPKSLSDNMNSVQEWARLYQEAAAQAALGKNVTDLLRQNPLSSFIDKARRIIVKSRKIRPPTSMGVLGPALGLKTNGVPVKVPSNETFTDDEKKIISYLWDVSMRRPQSQYSWAHASLIVRAVGAYPHLELDQKTFRMLLQELGCVNPWTKALDLDLQLHNTKVSWELDQLRKEALDSATSVCGKDGNTTFPDSMAHIRKDWGNIEALCIDTGLSYNIEDALSVEPANELKGGYWIHTHFAHPTAHFGVNHPVSQYARKRGAAYYDPDQNTRTSPMMPFSAVGQFSLRNGSPVLTVSTLLSMDGSVHNVKVVAGELKNVVRLDREIIIQATGADRAPEQAVLVVGKIKPMHGLPEDIKPSDSPDYEHQMELVSRHLPKLELMRDLLTARRKQRTQEMATPARFPKVRSGVTFRVNLPETQRPDREYESYHWQGDPGIVIRGYRRAQWGTFDELRADDVVAQAMRLASESLGKWFADRQIPAVFLGNDAPTGFSIKEVNEKGLLQHVPEPMFTRTAFPRPWVLHNMNHYAGCTSPLRKYIDMIAHFQADSYLKAEAQGLVQTGAPVHDDSILAFTKADIEHYLTTDAASGDALEDHYRGEKELWTLQALFRAFHFKEAQLPETLEMLVSKPVRRNALGKIDPASGILVPWAVNVLLEPSPEGHEKLAKYNEYLPIKLVSVNPAAREVWARATGPPSAEQQFSETIRSYSADNFLPENNTGPKLSSSLTADRK